MYEIQASLIPLTGESEGAKEAAHKLRICLKGTAVSDLVVERTHFAGVLMEAVIQGKTRTEQAALMAAELLVRCAEEMDDCGLVVEVRSLTVPTLIYHRIIMPKAPDDPHEPDTSRR